MAPNGAEQAYAPVLAALATMQQANVERVQKSQAHSFLEQFQKSPEAWQSTFAMLQNADVPVEGKMFAATTLKGKITYDLHQLPREALAGLRDSLISSLAAFRAGPKPVRTQLCVSLANLAIQMTEWKDVLPLVISTLGGDPASIPSVLEFLRVLPEEVTEGRKINLSEEDLNTRTKELLEDNAQQVLALLNQYARSSETAAKNPQLLECITSWSREVPINDVVNSHLIDIIFGSLSLDETFEAAVECLCGIFRETRDVDECINIIKTLYPRVVALQPRIAESAEAEDAEVFKGIARVFAEAGECWVLLIARMPENFRALVLAILETCARDQERDAISHTFIFWYELKQYLTLERYMEARLHFADVYSQLVDIMIGHLEYPKPEFGDEKDLFEGDREQEEKFREFRHQMGDVLKDCCEVIGVAECLRKPYKLIEAWVSQYGSMAREGNVPHWQKLEAPLFSMRAMGRMVPTEENVMLPQLVPLIVQIPDHEKVRFQAVMALGRYTEWTAEHPETLQPQLDFIMAAFNHTSKEVVRAAALSFKFFCNDCADLLKGFVPQLQQFYESQLDKLPPSSQDEITDGVASVLAKLPPDRIYENLKLYCDPVMKSLVSMAQGATDEKQKLALADKLQLITIFVQWVQPYIEPGHPHPAVKYCEEIFPILGAIAENFVNFAPVLERVCRSWRYMVLSYRTAMTPLLPQLANKLAAGFTASRQGCFLWATDSIVREFSEGVENVDEQTLDAIYQFYEQQATTFLRALNDLPPEELPDVIEDFFRLAIDVLCYYPSKALLSPLMTSIFSAATTALTLLKPEPLLAALHFLRDLISYGGPDPPSSSFDDDAAPRHPNPPEWRNAVKQLVITQGEQLVQRVLTGMMYSFPRDCVPDASGVLLALFQLAPRETVGWVRQTIGMLPQGSVSQAEAERLMQQITQRVGEGQGGVRRVRTLLQDFTVGYRRRNVAPREGLGRLEPGRFRFVG
ncbi:armadillo-type protein [Lineolata rhizophorae]|uniref:Armadillo-type protein n=1 Tax=Lineolata rhizophorae TaxID=578093 RepID=A0A6A6NLY5_9PEZI|nr:armadillo-type protein [Lineolata rhizophorae]